MVESRCGLLCSACQFKATHGCKGCVETMGNPFYGSCPIAACCQDRGYAHCGNCPDMPCQALYDYSCGDGEHCDKPKGARLEVLRQWSRQGLAQ